MGCPILVPILPIVKDLIDKYKNQSYCKIKNRLIPVNSNYRYNVYLKEPAVICGIRRELNTHLARHTFADIMLNSGVPLEDVVKYLGTEIFGGHSGMHVSVKTGSVKIWTK